MLGRKGESWHEIVEKHEASVGVEVISLRFALGAIRYLRFFLKRYNPNPKLGGGRRGLTRAIA